MAQGVDWKDFEWGKIARRLILHADRKLRARYWRSVHGGPVPGGLEAGDFAYLAINKTLDGGRPWDPVRTSLQDHLRDVVDSLISGRVLRPENAVTVRTDVDPGGCDAGQVQDGQPSPESVVISRQLEEKLLKHVSADVDLFVLLRAMVEHNTTKPQELAKILGLSVDEINNRKKRLRRAAIAYRNDPDFFAIPASKDPGKAAS
jgi:hypothetical protein